MKLVSMKEMLAQALDGKYAVGQFNVNNLEFTQAILLAAQEENAPVILGISEPYIPYLGGYKLVTAMVQALVEEWKIEVPVAVHLDHGLSFESCIKAMAAGFTSVMIDGSHHSLEENIAVTKRVVEAARAFNVSVEAELGRIAGREDDLVVQEADAMHAVPADCIALAQATGIDCIAPALGSVHGPYKGEPRLNFVRMEEIRKQTGIPLVLHGGTGIPLKDIQQAITLGTAKINVNTENQMACTSAVRQILSVLPNEYDPRKYLGPAREAVKETVKRKMREFGSSGKAEGR